MTYTVHIYFKSFDNFYIDTSINKISTIINYLKRFEAGNTGSSPLQGLPKKKDTNYNRFSQENLKVISLPKTKKKLKIIPQSFLNRNLVYLDIGNLDLSLRPYTCLKRAKIETVADLLQYSSEDLLNFKHFGKHSLNEVESILNQMGLKLRS